MTTNDLPVTPAMNGTGPRARAWLLPPLLLLCLLAAPRDGATQPRERPGDNPTANQLAEALDKIDAGKWLEAIEQLQRVMDTAGDELAPADQRRQLPARWVAQGHLSRLPPAALKLYRQRVDGQASRRVADAKKSPGDAALRKILAEMYNATASEEAILELARRAFAAGQLEEAAHYWAMLLPGEPEEGELRFPQPKTPAAAIRARLILVRIYRGDRAGATAALEALRKDSPDAAGLLAGKTSKYADTLAALLTGAADNTLPPPAPEPGWNTFAGAPDRNGNTHAPLPYFWPDQPAWKIPLPFPRRLRTEEAPVNPFQQNALAFHPVIGPGETLLADGRKIWSVDLKTGVATTVHTLAVGSATTIPPTVDVKHTLTLHGGRLYARLGDTALKPAGGPNESAPVSMILALGPRTAESPARTLLWKLSPPALPEATTLWEGCPIVTDDRLYASFWRHAGGSAVAGVACYRHGDGEAPVLLWQRVVGKSGRDPNTDHRSRHEVLTRAGGRIIVAPQAGGVMALDERTGQPVWEFRYPSDDRATLPRYRDLCPPLVADGRVFVAPADSDHLSCIDAFDGRLIWDRDGVEACHLLGVARGRLIATFGGGLKGLRGLNVRTGADAGEAGWTLHDQTGEVTFGRGLVTDDAVVWPTRAGLVFVSPEDGRPLRIPVPGSFGNLAYGEGCLIVATGTELWCYPSEGKTQGKKIDPATLGADVTVWNGRNRPVRAAQLRPGDPPKAGAGGAADLPAAVSPGLLEAPLDRRLVRVVDDPSLRILAESPRLIAVGEKLHAGALTIPMPAKHEVTFAAENATALLLAGPNGITALHPERLTVLWELLPVPDGPRLTEPDRPPLPLASGLEPATTFDSFTLAGDCLYVVHDGRDLLCYSVADGTLRWGRLASELSRRVPYTATWGPHLALSDKRLAVQTSDGAIGILDAETGAVRHATTTPSKPWIESPIVSEPGRFVWTGEDEVVLFDAGVNLVVARHELPNPDGLSGRPPRLRLHRNDLLMLVERNFGTELQVLQAENLKPRWARPALYLGRTVEAIAPADDRILAIADDRLSAWTWNDAEPLWSKPLGPSPAARRMAVTPAGVWVAPAEAGIRRRGFDAPAAFRRAGWNLDRLVRAVSDSYDVWTQREWSLMLFGPADGGILQRWNLPALGPAAGLEIGRTNVGLLTGHGLWRLLPLAEKAEP